MFVTSFSGRGSRPYPLDAERKSRVMVELAKKGMTINDLANQINVDRAYLTKIISGRDISDINEEKIARYFRMNKDYLFPPRSAAEIASMREAEKAGVRRGAA